MPDRERRDLFWDLSISPSIELTVMNPPTEMMARFVIGNQLRLGRKDLIIAWTTAPIFIFSSFWK